MTTRLEPVGFQPPVHRVQSRRRLVFAELITFAVLVFSLAVAATAVSIGIARAESLAPPAAEERLAVGALIGLVIVGMGGLTALAAGDFGRARRD
jgi:hypothetical protein